MGAEKIRVNKQIERLLWITSEWPSLRPEWWRSGFKLDLLCLSPEPHGFSEDDSRLLAKEVGVERILCWPGATGLQATPGGGPTRVHWAFATKNEELRRIFRTLLLDCRWDASLIDGLSAASPLIGDYGLEVPRSMSWLIYRAHQDETRAWDEWIEKHGFVQSLNARWQRKRIQALEKSILGRAARVVAPGEQNPF